MFAFSADNWRRPAAEVAALMALLQTYLASQTRQLAEQGMRVDFIGRRDRLPARLREAMDALEQATAAGTRLHLRIALDYSARAAIVRAAAASAGTAFTPQDFSLNLARASGADPAPCDVDLLIRTGGEKRLSDFLLWECAYAELWFTDTMWPDFTPTDLAAALADFRRRERRFGGLATVA